MTCSEFVDNYTDFVDGVGPEDLRRQAEDHLKGCMLCRRYHRVVTRGGEVLRGLPEARVPEDFHPRLVHRLYHVDDAASLASQASSAATFFTVMGMSLILTAIAWSPALRPSVPVVELPPIVVSDPPPVTRPANLLPDGTLLRPSFGGGGADLWDDAQQLLYEYSPLQQRYRDRAPLRRAGLDQDG